MGIKKPLELKKFLVKYLSHEPKEVPPLMLWGAPGIGKSEIVKQSAEEAFITEGVKKKLSNGELRRENFIKDIRLTLADPTDLKGLPALKGEKAVWLPPSQLPNSRDLPQGVVFLDELASAPPAVQVAAHRLVLDREIEEYKLPDGWHVIGASNRRSDRAIIYEMSAPLANRFIHIELQADLDQWKEWAYDKDIDSRIIAFLNFRPELLIDMNLAKNSYAFPTPRSWEFLNRLLRISQQEDYELIKSAVGEGAAAEFYGFLKVYKNIPDPNEALSKKIVPEEISEKYALCGAIAELYKKAPKKYKKQVFEYSYRLEKEYGVMLVRDCMKANKIIAEGKEWEKWASAFGDVIL